MGSNLLNVLCISSSNIDATIWVGFLLEERANDDDKQ